MKIQLVISNGATDIYRETLHIFVGRDETEVATKAAEYGCNYDRVEAACLKYHHAQLGKNQQPARAGRRDDDERTL